jgi:putative ATP-binding cassette transporter
MPQQNNNNSDGYRLARFWASASGFWRGKSAILAWSLTVSLLVMGLTQLAVQYRLNYWNRDFFNALGSRDAKSLWDQALIFPPLAFLSVGLSIALVWGRMTTQRNWRRFLTTHILETWLTNERYRSVERIAGEYKNAEYRIAVDARTSTDAPVDLAVGLVNSALTAAVFITVLWDVGGSITFTVGRVALTVPGYLVIGVVTYALVFTGAMVLIGRNLSGIIQMENQAEAEFLSAANKIRDSGHAGNSPIGENEKHEAWSALQQVLLRWRQLCWQLMGTTMVTQTDVLLAPAFAWILCAPKYLASEMTLGELTQASAAFVTVQVAFNWLVDNYQRLSDWRAAVNRVASLLLALDEVTKLETVSPPAVAEHAAATAAGTHSPA